MFSTSRANTFLSEDERRNNNEEMEQTDPKIDPMLTMKILLRVKTKAKPPSALNKKRTTREAGFGNSTRREPSRLEYKEANQRKTLR